MPTVSARETTEAATGSVHLTAPEPVYPAASRSVASAQKTALSQEVLDKQDKICQAVLAINDTLKEISVSLREICDAIKPKK